MAGRRSTLGAPLAALVLVVAVVVVLELRSAPASDGAGCTQPPCGTRETQPVEVPTVLDSASVCPGAGYLCYGLAASTNRRIVRWDESVDEIRVRIPRPGVQPASRALALQRAAARGIGLWDDSPFPIRIDLSNVGRDADIEVRWEEQLDQGRLGSVRTQWRDGPGSPELRIRDFRLSLRHPHDGSRTVTPEEVLLTAAHEMGHALGLPHSDSEKDVMYPTNTARALSTRDYITMESLYRLENGAEIR